MEKTAKIAVVVFVTLSIAGNADSQHPSADYERRAREMQAQHQRRAEEMRNLYKGRVAEMKAEFERRPDETPQARHERVEQQLRDRFKRLEAKVKAEFERSPRKAPPLQKYTPPPFDPATAPPPEDCLRAYIAATAKAQQLEELFEYLPGRSPPTYNQWKRKDWRDEAKAAYEKSSHRELQRRKRFAEQIRDLLKVTTDGEEAVIWVSTTGGGMINGVDYPYSKARIEMRGEGKYWKVTTYRDIGVYYVHPPQPR